MHDPQREIRQTISRQVAGGLTGFVGVTVKKSPAPKIYCASREAKWDTGGAYVDPQKDDGWMFQMTLEEIEMAIKRTGVAGYTRPKCERISHDEYRQAWAVQIKTKMSLLREGALWALHRLRTMSPDYWSYGLIQESLRKSMRSRRRLRDYMHAKWHMYGPA